MIDKQQLKEMIKNKKLKGLTSYATFDLPDNKYIELGCDMYRPIDKKYAKNWQDLENLFDIETASPDPEIKRTIYQSKLLCVPVKSSWSINKRRNG